MTDAEEPSEELIQAVASTLASMDQNDQRKMAALLHMTSEQFNRMIENWRASRN
jgi:hypothetical protein